MCRERDLFHVKSHSLHAAAAGRPTVGFVARRGWGSATPFSGHDTPEPRNRACGML